MDHSFYLCLQKQARRWGVIKSRITSKKPALQSGEIAIRVTVDVPDALFERPQLSAKITVPKDSVPAPSIDAIVTDNIAEVIKRELGVDMKITIENPES